MKRESFCRSDAAGNKRWILDGHLHREDGPAVEYANGDKYWLLNGKFHRENGPAIECADGNKYWYLNDEICLGEEEFQRMLKLKGFW